MKEYRVTINVRLQEVETKAIAGPGGQATLGERVLAVQITEAAGAGDTIGAAVRDAMDNGIEAYLGGMMEAGDAAKLFAGGAGAAKVGEEN